MNDRREEILKQQLGRYLLKIEDISHGTDAIPHALKLAMDEYMRETCLELLEYMAEKKVICHSDEQGAYFNTRGETLTKEQIFENFL